MTEALEMEDLWLTRCLDADTFSTRNCSGCRATSVTEEVMGTMSIHSPALGGDVPDVEFGLIGGSGTLSSDFPAGLNDPRVEVISDSLVFDTPFGRSPSFTHFRVTTDADSREALAVRMHGWRRCVKRADASLQVFWVFSKASVRKVMSDGGVGALNHLLEMRNIVVPDDFIDLTIKQDIYVCGDHLLIMREPVCPTLHDALVAGAEAADFPRVFRRGTYLVTDGPRFESPAEVDYMKRLGGDVIGQSFAPEVFLSRDIGACFAGIYLVVNYAEGIVRDWEHEELRAAFFEESERVSRIVLDVMATTPLDGGCRCMEYRKPTLLTKAEDVNRDDRPDTSGEGAPQDER